VSDPVDVEEWRPIPSLEGWEASSLGRFRWNGEERVPSLNKYTGYLSFSSSSRGIKDGKGHYAHHLVLEAFVGPRPAGMQTRHLNGVKHDNRSANLAWGSAKENAEDNKRLGRLSAPARIPDEDRICRWCGGATTRKPFECSACARMGARNGRDADGRPVAITRRRVMWDGEAGVPLGPVRVTAAAVDALLRRAKKERRTKASMLRIVIEDAMEQWAANEAAPAAGKEAS
jgi:hypothetical protein